MTVRRMVPDERRALILRAARDLFSQRPYAQVSVADIARAAGVSPSLIVFHYGSKRSLFLAVLETAAGAIRAGLNELPGSPSLNRLRAGVRFYAGYARDHRAGFLSLMRGGQDVAEAAALVEAFRDELARQILADLASAVQMPADAGPGREVAGGVDPGGADPGGADLGREVAGGVDPAGVDPGGADTAGADPGGADTAGADPGGRSTLTFLAVRGYLGYVDAMVVHWLALPGDDRDQITPDMIADVAAGAFTGGHAAAQSRRACVRLSSSWWSPGG